MRAEGVEEKRDGGKGKKGRMEEKEDEWRERKRRIAGRARKRG